MTAAERSRGLADHTMVIAMSKPDVPSLRNNCIPNMQNEGPSTWMKFIVVTELPSGTLTTNGSLEFRT